MKIMLQSIAALAVLAAAPAAFACNTPVMIIGADGRPTYVSPERDVTSDLESLFGAAPAAGSILVVDARDRTGRWLAPGSENTLDEIAVLMGAEGNGFGYSGPGECVPKTLLLDPERHGKPVDPITLFPDEPATEGQPRSGLWQAQLGATKLEGCPPVMQGAFPKSAGALPAEWLQPRRVAFRSPFHPDQLEMSRTLAKGARSQLRWKSTGKGQWRAEVLPELFDQMLAGEGGGSKMIWTLTLVNDGEFRHETVLDIALPAIMMQTMGGGSHCRMISRNKWVRVGN